MAELSSFLAWLGRGFISSPVFYLQIINKQKQRRKARGFLKRIYGRQIDTDIRDSYVALFQLAFFAFDTTHLFGTHTHTHNTRHKKCSWNDDVFGYHEVHVAWSASQPRSVREPSPRGNLTLGLSLCSSRDASNTHTARCRCGRSQRLLLATQRITSR